MLFSDKSQRKFRINENLYVYTSNSFFKGEEDKLEIYAKTIQSPITIFKDYSFPFGLNGFNLINNEILICLCKKNETNGILSIYCLNDKTLNTNFVETNNFKVTSICRLLDDELKETNFYLFAGVTFEKKVEIQS